MWRFLGTLFLGLALTSGTAFSADPQDPHSFSDESSNVVPINQDPKCLEALKPVDSALGRVRDRAVSFIGKIYNRCSPPPTPEEKRAGFRLIQAPPPAPKVQEAAPSYVPPQPSVQAPYSTTTTDPDGVARIASIAAGLKGSAEEGYFFYRTTDGQPVFISSRVWKVYFHVVAGSRVGRSQSVALSLHQANQWLHLAFAAAEMTLERVVTVEMLRITAAQEPSMKRWAIYYTNLIHSVAQRLEDEEG